MQHFFSAVKLRKGWTAKLHLNLPEKLFFLEPTHVEMTSQYNSKTINDNSTNICFEVIKKDGQMKAFDEAFYYVFPIRNHLKNLRHILSVSLSTDPILENQEGSD